MMTDTKPDGRQFNIRLTEAERDVLEAERKRLGLSHLSDVIRLWIAAVGTRRADVARGQPDEPPPLPIAVWAEGFGLSRDEAIDEAAHGRLLVVMPKPGAFTPDDVWRDGAVEGEATLQWLTSGTAIADRALAHVEQRPALAGLVATWRSLRRPGPLADPLSYVKQ